MRKLRRTVTLGLFAALLSFVTAVGSAPSASAQTDCGVATATSAASVLECEALVALYDATNGPAWSAGIDLWNTSADPCTWTGVWCNATGVHDLQLTFAGLTGSLPVEIGNLTNLAGLRLSQNQLSGAIPVEIGNLVNLTSLDLNDNQLSGAIPAEIGALTNLTALSLGRNDLSGSIPPELGNLINLSLLTLNGNQLSGLVPSSLTNLTLAPGGESLLAGNGCLIADAPTTAWVAASLGDSATVLNQGCTAGMFTPFADVVPAEFYEQPVGWAFSHGITQGTTATLFSPDATVTRAQIATFLWRLADEPSGASHPFIDVLPGEFYEQAVAWMSENEITEGTTATLFSPDATVTRAQLATFLWRYHGEPTGFSHTFIDIPPGEFYEPAVAWLATTGITQGTSDTTFSPGSLLSRAEAVTFLYRYNNLFPQ